MDRVKKWLGSVFRAPRIADAKRIVLGAGRTVYPGWYSTNRETLDLLKRGDFARHWQPGTREAFLAEHVWEHLSEDDGRTAARNCYEFLRAGGRLRIAVPDGHNPDSAYREYVRPGGTGPGADDHKVLYTAESLHAALTAAGYACEWLEYWDASGKFHAKDWRAEDGYISRSKRFDSRNADGVLRYTSLIIDALKPSQP